MALDLRIRFVKEEIKDIFGLTRHVIMFATNIKVIENRLYLEIKFDCTKVLLMYIILCLP